MFPDGSVDRRGNFAPVSVFLSSLTGRILRDFVGVESWYPQSLLSVRYVELHKAK